MTPISDNVSISRANPAPVFRLASTDKLHAAQTSFFSTSWVLWPCNYQIKVMILRDREASLGFCSRKLPTCIAVRGCHCPSVSFVYIPLPVSLTSIPLHFVSSPSSSPIISHNSPADFHILSSQPSNNKRLQNAVHHRPPVSRCACRHRGRLASKHQRRCADPCCHRSHLPNAHRQAQPVSRPRPSLCGAHSCALRSLCAAVHVVDRSVSISSNCF